MREKAETKQKFCGNCGNHCTYKYPDLVFCSQRFSENKNPVVETLWCCEEWNPSSQECCCVEDAMKKKSSK
jgi:hypothetical protein